MLDIKIPLTVPASKKSEYRRNYLSATNHSGQMLLIAGDQKIEHLNDDFFGPKINQADSSPEHLFKIALASKGGLLATHLGLISRYGVNYPRLPYLVKLNGKTNIGENEEKNSSGLFWSIEDIINFKKQSGLNITGIGYTLYLGGQYEGQRLQAAAAAIYQAHQNGLIAVLWVYPRGKNIKEEDIHTIAGGAGVAACLDADFVKVKYPYNLKDKNKNAAKFQEVVLAAGRTKVICVGGEQKTIKELTEHLSLQIKISGTSGLAIGRNLHQRSLSEASKLADSLGKIIFAKSKKNNPKFLGLF